MEKNTVYAKISRYSVDDKEKRIDSFEVPHARAMTILSMLRYIRENMDPTVSFRDFRCGRGVCHTCRVKVNGKMRRMCETPAEPGKEVLLEPAVSSKIIKDLVIDFN